MKHFTKLFLIIVMLVLSVSGYSKHTEKEAEQIVDRYLTFLDHECQGVVESSIVYAAKMQFDYPDQDYNKIIEKLDYLAENDSRKSVRIKAFVAAGCLKNPEDFKWVKNITYEEMDRLSLLFQDKIDTKQSVSTR